MITAWLQKSWLRWLLLALIGIVILVLVKDLLEASLEGYSFYWYESLLFGSFWLLFIPLLSINGWIAYYKEPRLYWIYALFFTLLHILLFAAGVAIISSLFLQESFGMGDVLRRNGPENGAIALLVYGLGNFFFKMYQEQRSKKVAYAAEPSGIRVSKAGKQLVLHPSDIICVRSESPYIAIITAEGRYLHNASLSGFLSEYATSDFVRVHRSGIVNTSHVHSYKSRGNGDYDLSLSNGLEMRLSRNYGKEFLSRFH